MLLDLIKGSLSSLISAHFAWQIVYSYRTETFSQIYLHHAELFFSLIVPSVISIAYRLRLSDSLKLCQITFVSHIKQDIQFAKVDFKQSLLFCNHRKMFAESVLDEFPSGDSKRDNECHKVHVIKIIGAAVFNCGQHKESKHQ